jgi:TusA-related sulfurtransferase
MPVILVQKEVKAHAPQTMEVMVDNSCSVENVTRFGSSQGYQVSVKPQGQDFLLTLSK